MLYKEPSVRFGRRTMKSLGVNTSHLMRMRSASGGEEQYFFAEFEGPGHVSFSRDKGGEVRVMDLPPGQTVQLRSGHLICFDESIRYYPKIIASYQVRKGNETETVNVVVDELTGPGTIVFQAYGNILSFQLRPGESMRTSLEALLLSQNTVGMRVDFLGQALQNALGGVGLGSVGQMFGLGNAMMGTNPNQNQAPVIDLVGPGQVMVHSGT